MTEKSRIFVSHTAKDKEHARDIAWGLKRLGHPVWFDEWEIAVGDSIVEKVFDGLQASDTLIVLLSSSSVESRWVKEELSVAVMRRISESDIRVLPVLIETCEIPTPLKHIRYADYRDDHDEGMSQLLEALTPGHVLWKSLAHHYDHFCLLAEQISRSELNEKAADDLIKMHDLLDTALNFRTEMEFRRARQKIHDLNFFEKIGMPVEKGVDVRSQTWNALVHFRACLAHDMKSRQALLDGFVHLLKERHETSNMKEGVYKGLDRLKEIMGLICFEYWNYETMQEQWGIDT